MSLSEHWWERLFDKHPWAHLLAAVLLVCLGVTAICHAAIDWDGYHKTWDDSARWGEAGPWVLLACAPIMVPAAVKGGLSAWRRIRAVPLPAATNETELSGGQPLRRPHVELLWWDGCPSHPQALAQLREVLDEEGLDSWGVEVREIPSDETAELEGFVGSPTIRIDGRDVAPTEGEPVGLTCRVYHTREGRVSPVPDREDLREALRRHLSTAPDFSLPDTEGAEHGPDGVTVVVFTCNHCPYALAWHERLLAVASDYADRGVRTLLINPNDAQRYPRDSAEAMRKRVAEEGPWPAPYLRDESQEVARAFGAQTTPDVFVLDGERRVRYSGAPDSQHGDQTANAQWLRDALDAVLEGREPDPAQTDPVGCSVKWKA